MLEVFKIVGLFAGVLVGIALVLGIWEYFVDKLLDKLGL